MNESSSATHHVILWDIGDTLLVVDGRKAFREFGYFNLSAYFLTYLLKKWTKGGKHASFKDHIEDLFLQTLAKIPSPFGSPGYDFHGKSKPVPPIQQDFLLGKLSGHEAVELIHRWMHTHPEAFESRLERSIFRKCCNLFFENYEDMLKYSPLFQLFEAAYLATDANGERLNTNIILSNWERDVSKLKDYFPGIFEYSSAQIISGIEDLTKPQLALFERAKEEFPKLVHFPWFLVDDQEANRQAAARENITPIAPSEAKKAFKAYGLI